MAIQPNNSIRSVVTQTNKLATELDKQTATVIGEQSGLVSDQSDLASAMGGFAKSRISNEGGHGVVQKMLGHGSKLMQGYLGVS